ncbi:hypothetical protein KY289_016133 [Solanum tuberosum]|nr:hypothetical protein KY289_016133 [Solanum tuberosum]
MDSNDEALLSGALVDEDLAAVQRRLVEMLRRELHQEMRKGLEKDRLMVRIWKTVRTIFTCVAPGQELSRVEKGDFQLFTFMDEAATVLVPPEDLDSDVDTTQSEGS